MWADSKTFQGVLNTVDANGRAKLHLLLPVRESIDEVKEDLKKHSGFLDYIDNERGFRALPNKV